MSAARQLCRLAATLPSEDSRVRQVQLCLDELVADAGMSTSSCGQAATAVTLPAHIDETAAFGFDEGEVDQLHVRRLPEHLAALRVLVFVLPPPGLRCGIGIRGIRVGIRVAFVWHSCECLCDVCVVRFCQGHIRRNRILP